MNDAKKATSHPLEGTPHVPGRSLLRCLVVTVLLSLTGLGDTKAQTKDGNVDITPGFKIIEGDIQVPEISPLAPFASNLYPNGIVPFEFDANVTQANQNAMLTAMAQLNGLGKVSFQQCANNNCTGQANYVHIQDATANNSPIGAGGMRIINITSWGSTFSMVHELSHTCGFYHEQSRADRDTYVTINTANIQTGLSSNFDIQSAAGIYGYYDFDSVMHYGKCDFSIGCPAGTTCACAAGTETITVKPPNDTQWQNAIGQRTHYSYLDGVTMSSLYAKDNWRFVDQAFTGTPQGTFLSPYKDFFTGQQQTPAGGTLWIQPGTYSAIGTYGTNNKAETIRAPLGHVTLH